MEENIKKKSDTGASPDVAYSPTLPSRVSSSERIRQGGIDRPESGQAYGKRAKQAWRELFHWWLSRYGELLETNRLRLLPL